MISFAMLLSLTSISLGLHRASEERLSESPRDIVVASTGLEPSIEDSHEVSWELVQDEDIERAMPILTVLGKIAFSSSGATQLQVGDRVADFPGTELMTMGMIGIVPDMAKQFMKEEGELFIRSDLLKFDGWFEQGGDPFYNSDYQDNWTGELLLDKTILEEYDIDLGERVYQINGSGMVAAQYHIVGSIETSLVGSGLSSELVSGLAMVHLSELQHATDNHKVKTPEGERRDLSTAIYIDIEEEKRSTKLQKEISLGLEEKFPGLEVTTKENRLYKIDEEVLILEVFAVSVAAASISIGVLFLSSIMIIDVEDRRCDISIMRAIGISRRTIFLQTIKDSLVLSSIGGVLGLIPGWLGASSLNIYLRDLYGVNIDFASFEPLVMIGSFIYLFLLTSIFSEVWFDRIR
jgi:hypothetical protein